MSYIGDEIGFYEWPMGMEMIHYESKQAFLIRSKKMLLLLLSH